MRRSYVVVLAGSLLFAGSAGTVGAGPASASQPAERLSSAPVVLEELLRPEPRLVEPEKGRPGVMPHVMPQEPGPVPIPGLRPAEPGPAPMPQVGAGPPLEDGLDHRRGRSRPQPGLLPDELDPGTGAVLP